MLPEAGGPLDEGDTVLAILGDARRNKVKLRLDPGGLQYVIRDPKGVTPGAGCAAAGPDAAVCESLVDGYVAEMGGGDDVFVDQIGSATSGDPISGSQVTGVVSGQGGDDTIIGTTNASVENLFSGGAGDDQIHGGNSADVLVGGPGDDDLNGGKGRDRCLGGKGSDAAQDCEVRRGIP